MRKQPRADEGGRARLVGPVHGHELADAVAVADPEVRLAAREGQVLGLAAQDRALVHHVALAQRGEPLDHRVRAHLRAPADAYAALHDRVGPDGDAVRQDGAFVHEGSGMDGHGRPV
jgi:hypothetical protein